MTEWSKAPGSIWTRFLVPSHLFFTLCLAGCVDKVRDSAQARAVVATVDGMPIYLEEFRTEFKRSRLDGKDGSPSVASDQAQKRALLDNLLERRLTVREAENKNTLVSIEEVEHAYQRSRESWKAEEFDDVLRGKDLTVAELKQAFREMLLIKRYFREHVFSRVAVTDSQIEDYVESHPELHVQQEQVRARHLVVGSKEKALEIVRDLRRGELFEDLALKHSLGPEGKNGGDLGFFVRGVMPSIFDDVCFSLREKQVSDIVESSYGFHLFQLIGRRAERMKGADQVRDEAEAVLRRDLESVAQREKLKALKAKAQIKVYHNVIARVH